MSTIQINKTIKPTNSKIHRQRNTISFIHKGHAFSVRINQIQNALTFLIGDVKKTRT